MIKIHYLQHIPTESPDKIIEWVKLKKNISLTKTLLFKTEAFPNLDEFDWLIIMGGSMSVYDEKEFPWLKEEKNFIKKTISAGKVVFGICLGAQLIINSMGGKIFLNSHIEQGWFPVKKVSSHPLFSTLPKEFSPLHLHSDSFSLPEGTQLIASSEYCPNQAFIFNEKVIGFQFHLEISLERVKTLLKENNFSESDSLLFVQNPEKIIKKKEYFAKLEKLLFNFLDSLVIHFFPTNE